VSTSAARLLKGDDDNYKVRFVPNANYNGTATLTYQAWDQTSGTAGATAAVTTAGGSTAYSGASAAATVTVTAVNDAPTLAAIAVAGTEDTTFTFAAADFTAVYADTDNTALASVTVVTLPATGTLNPRNTFETFVVGANNQMAHAASLAVAQAPAQAYNPLFLYGDTGLGKTHLMHAIGHAILRANPDARVAYLSTEKFTNEFIQALQENSLTKFRQRYRHVDVLLIDDIQFLAGKERIQEEFFHTFNDLFEAGKQIILSSDRRASEIQKLEARLVSRFEWGLPADIQAPDLETRQAILRTKAATLKCNLSDAVLNFIAQNITKNIRRLEGALIKVASYTALTSKPMDVAAAERLLHDVLMEQAQTILTIETIQKRVADHFQIRHSDMTSKRRPNNIAIPRQIAMYLSRTLTKHSLQEIGDAFGGRDHGTVIHACKAVDNMCEQDASTRSSVDFLKTQLSK